MSDDYEEDDVPCPACGNYRTRFRHCTEIGCQDGFIDEYDDDPINYGPGEEYTPCPECRGYGSLRWCPKCGVDYREALKRLSPEKRAQHERNLQEDW